MTHTHHTELCEVASLPQTLAEPDHLWSSCYPLWHHNQHVNWTCFITTHVRDRAWVIQSYVHRVHLLWRIKRSFLPFLCPWGHNDNVSSQVFSSWRRQQRPLCTQHMIGQSTVNHTLSLTVDHLFYFIKLSFVWWTQLTKWHFTEMD